MKKILTILLTGFLLISTGLSYAIENTKEKTIKFIYPNQNHKYHFINAKV